NSKKIKGGRKIGLSDREIEKRVREFAPEVVGITSMFTAFDRDVHSLAALVKKINPEIKVIVGGAHASSFPELVIKDKNIDIVVIGEGEITFGEIVRALKNKKDYCRLKGTVARNKNKIFVNPGREYLADLDRLPFPAYRLLPMKAYFEVAKKSPYLMRQPTTGIISSRGCPGNCCYCSIHSVWGHTWRGRSPENVVSEIEFLIKNYKVKEFSFLDDSLACSPERLEKLCEEIIKRGLDIKWSTPNGIAHWNLNKRLLDKMKAAGCYRITFGIESASPQTRKFIGWKANFPLRQAKELIEYANKIGLWTIATFILGFPYERKTDIEKTVDFALSCDVDFAVFFLLMPFPGTRVYEAFKKEGLLNFDSLLDPTIKASAQNLAGLGGGLAQRGCQTLYFKPEELRGFLDDAYNRFFKRRFLSFLNPFRSSRKINSWEDFRYVLRLIKTAGVMKLAQIKNKEFSAHLISQTNKEKNENY
ncbi:MAG: radical SAM protein, partial [bacterium]|nr:radical SAM protein [bacterium]